MSCILAVTHNGETVIGADAFLGNTRISDRSAASKIFRRGDFYIGVAGSLRMSQVLRYSMPFLYFEYGGLELTVDQFLATTFADGLRATLEEHNLMGEDGFDEVSAILIVHKNRIFEIQQDFSVIESASQYYAIGAGTGEALGSLYAATKWGVSGADIRAYSLVEIGLSAAAEFSPYVREPFDIRVVKEVETNEQACVQA